MKGEGLRNNSHAIFNLNILYALKLVGKESNILSSSRKLHVMDIALRKLWRYFFTINFYGNVHESFIHSCFSGILFDLHTSNRDTENIPLLQC